MKNSQAWLNRLSQVECPNVTYIDPEFPIVLKRGEGLCLWDVDEKRYLDFTACFGVAAMGHTPSAVRNAITQQAHMLLHGMGDVHPCAVKIELLEVLRDLLPYSHPNTLLSSSGSEAVETALKTAVLATGRHRFVSFAGAYHGLLTGPLRLSDRAHFTQGFRGWLGQENCVLPFPEQDADGCLSLLEDRLKQQDIAAVILEPVQGRGGDRAFPKPFLQSLVQVAHRYGALVIFDEVFTGFGRTGKMFGFEHFDVVPDIICLGKAMGGGLPLSACAGEVLAVWGTSTGEARHTSTYLGHPLACAAALAHIREIAFNFDKIKAQLAPIEKALLAFAGAHELQVSGLGFMRGLKRKQPQPGEAFDWCKQLLQRGIVALCCGADATVLSLTPPLIADVAHFEALFKALSAILTSPYPDGGPKIQAGWGSREAEAT